MSQPVTRPAPDPSALERRDRTHNLYVAVVVAVVLGIALGFVAPGFAVTLAPVGAAFVALIKMMISPIIFCTIVLGVGSVASAAKVGKVGGLALLYFLAMSTVALTVGLVVGNVIKPVAGLNLTGEVAAAGAAQAGEHSSTGDFLLGIIIPTTLFSALTSGEVLQTVLVALLVGFALQAMVAFYVTCAVFVFVLLGAVLRLVTGVNVFSLLRYLAREFLLILSTSSSESALPRLIAKMEHAGVEQSTVGVVVPTGYSFNLDGTVIYLTMASLFIAEAMGKPLNIGEQISLLVFMVIASKGAAGVTGAWTDSQDPFDETTMLDDHQAEPVPAH